MTELIKPWSKEKRTYMQGKIDAAAKAAAKKLGARCCLVVAFFEDGDYYHIQDGGQSTLPPADVYRQLLAVQENVKTETTVQ